MHKISKNDPTAPYTIARLVDGDLFAMKFNDGWLVGRCLESELIPKRDTNWPAIATGVAAGPLQSDGATAGGVPDTPRTIAAEGGGRTFLYHKEKDKIMQVFAGVNVPLGRVYYEVPEGTKHGDLLREDLGVPTLTAAAISTWGWQWTGYQSMNAMPKRISMAMLPYQVDMAVAMFNQASQTFTPIFDWLINNVRYESLDPADKEDQKLIVMVLKNRLDEIKYSPGIRGYNYAPGFRNIFKVDPVIQTRNAIFGIPKEGQAGKYVIGE